MSGKNLFALESQKNEFGVYFGTKIYEERHPVDNSFFMSQDGWMLGLIGNSETYSNDLYTGFKYQLGYGQVDYTSAGTGTMTGIPDYQLEGTGYIGIPINLNDNLYFINLIFGANDKASLRFLSSSRILRSFFKF